VWAYKEGEYFDLLADFDVIPMKRCQGFVSLYRWPEDQVIYPDLASLRRAGIYEWFLLWANAKLARARWIKLYKSSGIWGADLVCRDLKKDQPTPGMLIGQALVSLSGDSIFDPERDEMKTWVYPVFPVRINEPQFPEV
jgi:hypothetical protein